MLEGETASSINAEMRFGERVLPTLDSNIKSGNSLIDLDFYDTQIDFGEEKKIKPFNWQQAFPNIFSSSLRVINFWFPKKLFEDDMDKANFPLLKR